LKAIIGIDKLVSFYDKESEDNKLEILATCVKSNYSNYQIHSLLEKSISSSAFLKKCFDIVVKEGFKPTSITFLLMMEEFIYLQDLQAGIDIFKEMDNFYVIKNSAHYLRLFIILRMKGDAENTMRYFHEMIQENIQPNEKMPYIIIDSVSKSGRTDYLIDTYNVLEAYYKPDVRMINCVMKAMSDIGNAQEVLKYFEHFTYYGLNPKTRSYNIVMEAFFKMGDSKSLEKFYKKLVSSNLRPNSFTFDLLIRSLTCSKDTTKIDFILSEIQKYNNFITPSQYIRISTILDSLREDAKKQQNNFKRHSDVYRGLANSAMEKASVFYKNINLLDLDKYPKKDNTNIPPTLPTPST